MNKIKNIQKEIGAEYWKEVDSTNFIKLYKLYKATLLDIQGQHRLQNKLKYRDNILVERFAQTVGLLQTEDGSSLCQEWKHGCILGTCWTAVEWNWNLPRSSLQKPAMVTKQLHKGKNDKEIRLFALACALKMNEQSNTWRMQTHEGIKLSKIVTILSKICKHEAIAKANYSKNNSETGKTTTIGFEKL